MPSTGIRGHAHNTRHTTYTKPAASFTAMLPAVNSPHFFVNEPRILCESHLTRWIISTHYAFSALSTQKLT